MPKLTFKTKDEVPEGLRDHAKETDGGFVVGVVHESFRDRNIALSQERDELKTKVDSLSKIVGDDVEGFSATLAGLREMEQHVKDGKLTKKEDIDRTVEARMQAKEAGHRDALKAAQDKANAEKARGDGFESKFKGMVVDQAIISAVTAADSGANPAALQDILNRARAVFQAKDDGTLVAKKGETVWYGADGENSIQPKEWLAGLLKDAPYLGKESAGTGGAGGKGLKVAGMSDEAFQKLSPEQRIAASRKASR